MNGKIGIKMSSRELKELGQQIGVFVTIFILIIAGISLIIYLVDLSMPKPMSNDQIIKETKKCESAGMKSYTVMSAINNSITRVICDSKDEKNE